MDYSNLDPLILRRIIIDHYANPNHKTDLLNMKGFTSIYLKSKSCIDEITIHLKIKNKNIVDYKFAGTACSICIAASDIIGDIIINKSIQYSNKIISNYKNLVNKTGNIDNSLLFELVCFHSIYKLPARKKCALLTVEGIEKVINN